MSSPARFDLYVKAALDGSLGDCPFSQRSLMYAKLKLKEDQYQVLPMDTSNKTDDFLALNPDGKVPVLVDHSANDKVISDSGEINKYIDSLFPLPDCKLGCDGEAIETCSGVFPKFAGLMKNQDDSKLEELKNAVRVELKKVDDFLKGCSHGGKFLLGDSISEVDCSLLPKLRHVMVAGKHYRDFTIPAEFSALHEYIKNAEKCDVFQSSCCQDQKIIQGWSKFF